MNHDRHDQHPPGDWPISTTPSTSPASAKSHHKTTHSHRTSYVVGHVRTSKETRKNGSSIRPRRQSPRAAPTSLHVSDVQIVSYVVLRHPDRPRRSATCHAVCPTKPVMRPGWITGFKPKMWVSFPTLIPLEKLSSSVLPAGEAKLGQGGEISREGDAQTRASESSIKIHGMFWKVEDYQHFWTLQQYETSAYRGYWCRIHVENNSRILENSVVSV